MQHIHTQHAHTLISTIITHVHIHTHTHMHTHKHTHTHMHTHKHTHTQIHTHTHMHVHTSNCTLSDNMAPPSGKRAKYAPLFSTL